jgi:hypothetical protein
MQTGLHQTGSGHVSVPDPCLGPVQGPCMFRPGTLGPHCGGPDPIRGGVRIPFQGSVLHTMRSRTNRDGNLIRGFGYPSDIRPDGLGYGYVF